MDGTKCHKHHLKADTLSNTQPIQTNKRVGDVVGATSVEDQTGSNILDRLEPSDAERRKTKEDSVKEIKLRAAPMTSPGTE